MLPLRFVELFKSDKNWGTFRPRIEQYKHPILELNNQQNFQRYKYDEFAFIDTP